MGLDNFDRPPTNDVNIPLESLREELNSLDRGLAELLTRRRDVLTAIRSKMDDTHMHLGSSEEHFAKATGNYGEEKVMVDMPMPREGTTRGGW